MYRHAVRYGCEAVWETGEQLGLRASTLVRLADRLAGLDKSWRLPQASKVYLALELLDEGWSLSKVAQYLRVRTDTVAGWAEDSPGGGETGFATCLFKPSLDAYFGGVR